MALLLFVSREWLTTRLEQSIRYEYDQKLEAFKVELQARSDVALLELKNAFERSATQVAVAHSSFAEGQKAAMERRLQALDVVWKWVIEFRENRPAILGMLDIITDDELKNIGQHASFIELTKNLSVERVVRQVISAEIEKARPYIGEFTWAVIYSYRAILLRIVFLVTEKDPKISNVQWVTDTGISGLLKAVVTQSEFKAYEDLKWGRINWLTQTLEGKILAAFQKTISGESFGAAALEQALTIQRMAEELSQKTTAR